jgi:hypothetical protein
VSSIYQNVLETVETVLISMTLANEPLEGWRITLRKEAVFVPEQDRFPQVIIAPNRFLAVTPKSLQFGRQVVLLHDVFSEFRVKIRNSKPKTQNAF